MFPSIFFSLCRCCCLFVCLFSFLKQERHFEFQSYGGSWHRATLGSVSCWQWRGGPLIGSLSVISTHCPCWWRGWWRAGTWRSSNSAVLGVQSRLAVNFFLQLRQHWWQSWTAPWWRWHNPRACQVFSIFFIAHEVWICSSSSACLSFPEATFMCFMKSCKERFAMIE